ncbi:hypothetical protein HC928_05160 [bacterium]|nr:hypothetical protein [bacterium]
MCDTGFNGTSSSATHVAGMAALLFSNPNSSMSLYFLSDRPDRLEHYLMTRTVDLYANRDAGGTPDGYDNTYGSGLVQLGDPNFDLTFPWVRNWNTPQNAPADAVYVGTSAIRNAQGNIITPNGTINAPYNHPARAIQAAQSTASKTVVFLPGEYLSGFRLFNDVNMVSYNSQDSIDYPGSSIWVGEMFEGGGGVTISGATSGARVEGFDFNGANRLYDAYPGMNPLNIEHTLRKITPLVVTGSGASGDGNRVSIVGNTFTNFDYPVQITDSNNVWITDNVFRDFDITSVTFGQLTLPSHPTAALEINNSGLGAGNRLQLLRNSFEDNFIERGSSSSNVYQGIVSITYSGVDILASRFINNTAPTVININQWQGGSTGTTGTGEEIVIFSSIFDGNDVSNGTLIHLYQGRNFRFTNNTVANHTIRGPMGNIITVGDRTSTAEHILNGTNKHRADVFNNLLYNNDINGGLIGRPAQTDVTFTFVECRRVGSDTNQTAVDNNWFAPRGNMGSGMCEEGTITGNNTITDTWQGVQLVPTSGSPTPEQIAASAAARADFEETFFFTAANDPADPYRLRPTSQLGEADPNLGIDTGDDSLALRILTSLDPSSDERAYDAQGGFRAVSLSQGTAGQLINIDIGAYETGQPEPIQLVSGRPAQYTLNEDNTITFPLTERVEKGFRPYRFTITSQPQFYDTRPESPCGGVGVLINDDGTATFCPAQDFFTYGDNTVNFSFRAQGALLPETVDDSVTLIVNPVDDGGTPADLSGPDDVDVVYVDSLSEVDYRLRPFVDFDGPDLSFSDPDVDVDYGWTFSNFQTVELTGDAFTSGQVSAAFANAATTGRLQLTPSAGEEGVLEFTYAVRDDILAGGGNGSNSQSRSPARRARIVVVRQLATAGLYDNTALNMFYQGGWTPIYNGSDDVYRNTLHRTATTTSSFEFQFIGDTFILNTRGSSSTGSYTIEIDHDNNGTFLPYNHSSLSGLTCSLDNKPTNISTTRSSAGPVIFGCTGLDALADNVLRTLRVKTVSSAPINLDSIEIRDAELGPTVLNDDDVTLLAGYSTGWTPSVGVSGPMGDSVHFAEIGGATVSFVVDGDEVDYLAIYRTLNPAHGSLRVSISGLPNQTFANNDSSERVWSQPITIVNIPNGPRTVTLTSFGGTNLEAIHLLSELPVLQPGHYDSHAADTFHYVGNWLDRTNSEAVGGQFKLNLEIAASMVMEIDGAGIVVMHTMNADRDRFEVCFNGNYDDCTTVSAQVGTRWFGNRQVISAPNVGRHTVEIRSVNESAFSVEAIEVLDVQQALSPGYYEEDDSDVRYTGYWRPRLSTLSLGTNIQVAETTGQAQILVDMATFSGLGFYYRGGPEYGLVRVCAEGFNCVQVNQFRSSRVDGILQTISVADLGLTGESGVQTLTFKRPSGFAFINIEALEIMGPLGPGLYTDSFSGFAYSGSDWEARTGLSGPLGSTLHFTNTDGATLSFSVDGDTVDTVVIYRTMNPAHGSMRVEVNGKPTDVAGVSTYIDFVADHDSVTERQWMQPEVVVDIGPGLQTVTITNIGTTVTNIEGIELFGPQAVLTPGVYNSHDSRLNYIGGWENRTNSEAVNGDFKLNLERKGSAVMEIDGAGIVVMHTMNADRDFFEVCFNGDDANCTVVSAEVGARWFGNRQVISAPSEGRHTVEIRSANESAFSIEAIEVLDTQQPLAPGYYQEDDSDIRYTGYWRPRLSILSLGNNIQVAETGGTAQFMVNMTTFNGLGFYYRGGPEYGQAQVCAQGFNCVSFNQFRNDRTDGILQTISVADLGLTGQTGVQTITFSRPSGSAFINIEALAIIAPLGPGLYEDNHPGLVYTGTWQQQTNTSGPVGSSLSYTEQNGATLSFLVDGDTVDTVVIHRTMNPDHGNMRVQVNGLADGAAVSATTYVNRVVSNNDVTDRQWAQPEVIVEIGPGPQTVTVTQIGTLRTNIEAVELIGPQTVLSPGTYNSHDSGLRYAGNWGNREVYGAVNGNFWLNQEREASLLVEIDGAGIVVMHTMNNDRDSFEVCFNGDDATCTTVSAQVGTRWFGNRQVISAPSVGRHTVEIRSVNESAFSIEAIEVLGTQAVLLPGYYEEDNSDIRYTGYWRPRLSTVSLGTNIQVAETGGTAQFLVDMATFDGLDFYYRGGPEYGQARVCAQGFNCVTFNQFRSSRTDGILQTISVADLGLTGQTGVQTITLSRPSGSAFINIEALVIRGDAQTLAPGYYEDLDPNLEQTAGVWQQMTDSDLSNLTAQRSESNGATMQFSIGGGTGDERQVTGFTVFVTRHTTNPAVFEICYTRQSTSVRTCTDEINATTGARIATYGYSVYGLLPETGGGANETYLVEVINRATGRLEIDAVGVYGLYGPALTANDAITPFYDTTGSDFSFGGGDLWTRVFEGATNSALFTGQYTDNLLHYTEATGVPMQFSMTGNAITVTLSVGPSFSNEARICFVSGAEATLRCVTFSQNNSSTVDQVPLTIYGIGTGSHNVIIENLDPLRGLLIDSIIVY